MQDGVDSCLILRRTQNAPGNVSGGASVLELAKSQITEAANVSKDPKRKVDQALTEREPAGKAYVDDAGEGDLEFFRARPDARTRIRSPFPGEFGRKVLKRGRGRPAIVIVAIERDATGRPTRRARGILFPDGGHA